MAIIKEKEECKHDGGTYLAKVEIDVQENKTSEKISDKLKIPRGKTVATYEYCSLCDKQLGSNTQKRLVGKI